MTSKAALKGVGRDAIMPVVEFCLWLILSMSSRHTDFFFANRRVHRSNCSVFAPDSRAGPIPRLLVGYFHYSYVESARRRKLQARLPPVGRHNEAGERLSRKKLSKVTPEEWSRDPYLVCLVLSLAQRQARSLASPQQITYVFCLLVTTTKKPDHCHFIFLYETEITSQLLDSLDKPTFATERTAWPTIKFKRIPFMPSKDFQARLIAELLAPNPLGHHEALDVRDGTNFVKE
ncbi:hypothetical protein HIM_05801 [Hirsutella minnesotensis 3608]|uniref:Uncharacterized protein n=1 Tax=Hirsutella minnesotensis 3608 TaxID=1043627 RepID=A0A0F7ZZY5_9HYPO|nr:hypothetical protein HIM_05801 [Hirsutella minnesotensis 3608]